MASLDHRLNPLFSIKECMTCGALYTADFCCSKGGLEDKILVPKPPQNCATCGDPLDGLNYRSCAFVRKCLNEGWYTIHDKNEILNTFESFNDNINVVSTPQEPFVFNQDPGVNSSQSLPQINHNCCYKCGDSLDGIFCQRCTCKSCGNGAHIGYNCPPKAPIISNPEPCNKIIDESPQILSSVHLTFNSEDANSFTYDSKPNFVDDSPNVFNPPPQPSLNSCEFCGNDARYGHYCTHQVPFIYPEPCYNQDFNFPQDFHDFQQQYLCCENYGGPHETFQCQPMNEDYYHEQNSCYDPNSFGFDQFQPPQYTINHPILNAQNEFLNSQNKLMEQMTSICDMVGQIMQKKEEERRIAEDQAAKDRYWKIPICYDDDEDYTIAITPVLSTKEVVDSLIMEDEHLDTIPATESDEVIKSSVENLVPIPSEFKGISEDTCLFHDDPSKSVDSILEGFIEDPPFKENEFELECKTNDEAECFNPEGDNDEIDAFLAIEVPTYNEGYYDSEGDVTYLESLLSDDTTHNLSPELFFDHEPHQLRNEPENEPLITFSPKSDPLHHEFTGEIITIPPGIVREHEDYINRMSLLCSNSSSQTPENFHTIIESLPTSTTLIEVSDPNREEIDIFSGPDDSIPPGIESDFDSEDDIINNLLNNDSTHERLTFNIEPDAPVINNVDELNEDECFDPGGGEINVEVDDSFTIITWTFLPFLTYPEVSPLLSSTKNKDTIYDPGIST
ncbi:hypothetical protein Tco_0894709 [Tanacetum coccineum]|uniref:CCHC-type domain-containing protein n=1 Tax=Tanacetum coccineum TaxID=301880 RepID=A0ABQ5CDY5_9ASTR